MSKILFTNKLNLGLENKTENKLNYLNDFDVLKKRSKKYLELITALDSDLVTDTKGINDLIKDLQEELGIVDLTNMPLGIVARCYLGHPYEVHTLDLSKSMILKHYKKNESLEGELEKARFIALHNAYSVVEVYTNKMIVIHADGTATSL